MSIIYADTSALLGAYLSDESQHQRMRSVVLEGDEPVVTSDLALVELASATRAAEAAGRIGSWSDTLGLIDAAFEGDGLLTAIRLRPEAIFPVAREVITRVHVKGADAIHIAVALVECTPMENEVRFLSADRRQSAAAEALGLHPA